MIDLLWRLLYGLFCAFVAIVVIQLVAYLLITFWSILS